MINTFGTPCLADFGLSSIAEDIYSVIGSNAASRGSVRWYAPELVGSITTLRETRVKPNAQSDILSHSDQFGGSSSSGGPPAGFSVGCHRSSGVRRSTRLCHKSSEVTVDEYFFFLQL